MGLGRRTGGAKKESNKEKEELKVVDAKKETRGKEAWEGRRDG